MFEAHNPELSHCRKEFIKIYTGQSMKNIRKN